MVGLDLLLLLLLLLSAAIDCDTPVEVTDGDSVLLFGKKAERYSRGR